MSRRRPDLPRVERDAYLAPRTSRDAHAAQDSPAALASRIARREVRRRLYAAGAPALPPPGCRKGRAAVAPAMSPLGAVAVLLGLLILVGGTIACAVAGSWAGMVLVVPFGFGPMLWAGRGGRDGLRR